MQKLSLSKIITAIGVLPFLFMVLFASFLLLQNWLLYRDATQSASLSRLATAAANLAIQLPLESRPSIVFAETGNSAALKELTAERSKTDAAVETLRTTAEKEAASLGATLQDDVRFITQQAAALGDLRQRVDRQDISEGAEILKVTKPMTDRATRINEHVGFLVDDARISRLIVAKYSALMLADANNSELGMISQMVEKGYLAPGEMQAHLGALNGLATFSDQFEDIGAPAAVQKWKSFQTGADAQTIADMQRQVLGLLADKAPDRSAAGRWTAAMNSRRAALYDVIAESETALSATTHDVESVSRRNMAICAVAVLFALSCVIAMMWGALKTIRGLLSGITASVAELSHKHFGITVPSCERSDEIGIIARAVRSFQDILIAQERADVEQAAEQAARARRAQTIESSAQTFDRSVSALLESTAQAAADIRNAAEEQASFAALAGPQLAAVARASAEATSNVQTVASAAEQLSSSIAEISRQVDEAAKISTGASDITVATNAKIQDLAAAADRIGQVVQLINDIASQTNLLALNATIEAARAGDAGKGFAVVAGEVKNLATQTARATGEISSQISAVQDETKRAVEAIQTIGTVIEQVREISSGIASAVEEQGAATREIARNVQEVVQGTTEVSRNIDTVATAVEGAAQIAEKTRDSADALAKGADTLQGEVTTFLSSVRSA